MPRPSKPLPRPTHPKVGTVVDKDVGEDVGKDVSEDVSEDVDKDVDEDANQDVIEDVDEGANENVYENEYMKVEGRKKVAKAKASQSRPSPWPRSIVNDGNCSLASSSILIVIFGVVRLFLALQNVWSCPPQKSLIQLEPLNNY